MKRHRWRPDRRKKQRRDGRRAEEKRGAGRTGHRSFSAGSRPTGSLLETNSLSWSIKLNTMATALLSIPTLVIVLFPLLTTGDVDDCNCLDVSLEDRLSCGAPEISFDQCQAMGCCYDSRFYNRPFCYVNAVKENKIEATNQQKLYHGDNKEDSSTKEKEQQEMEDLCKKCDKKKVGGLFGFIENIFGSRRPAECKKCEKSSEFFKRGEEKEDPTS